MGLGEGLKLFRAKKSRVRTLNDQIPIFVCPFSIIPIWGEGGKMPARLYAPKMGISHSKRGSVSLRGRLSPKKKWDAQNGGMLR